MDNYDQRQKVSTGLTFLSPPEGPPSQWASDEFGAPAFLDSGVRTVGFAMIIPDPARIAWLSAEVRKRWEVPQLERILRLGPAQMPRFPRGDPHDRLRRFKPFTGRPTRELAELEAVRAIAWLLDYKQLSTREIQAVMLINYTDDASANKAVRRYRDSGRRVLAALGVLPWSLWDNGNVPKGWWVDPVFGAGLERWIGLNDVVSLEIAALRRNHRDMVASMRRIRRLKELVSERPTPGQGSSDDPAT